MTRKKIIAGNWKMNNLKEDVVAFFEELGDFASNFDDREVIIAPSIPYVLLASEKKGKAVKLGVQDIYPEKKGAFTGQVGSEMVKDLSAEFVIIGHSERRHVMNESLEMIRKKVTFAQEEGFKIIYCVGETLSQRQKNELFAVIEKQLSDAFDNNLNISDEDLIIAYEPVWAIGTGVVASKDEAEEMHKFIRNYMKEHYNKENVRILYGGSVKPANVKELLSMPNIDGALVGGASLKADSFKKLIAWDK